MKTKKKKNSDRDHDYSNTVISLRLDEKQAVRFWIIADNVKMRHPYISKSEIMRELFGLIPRSALKRVEINWFFKGDKE